MNKTTPTLDRDTFAADYIRIVSSARKMEKYATREMADRFFLLTERLLAANAVMNLTAITDPREIILKHYFDSLRLAQHLHKVGASLADVGCGAGFPGVPGMPDGKGGFPAPGVFAPQGGGAPQNAPGTPNAPNGPDGSGERQADAAPAGTTKEAEA